MYRSKEVAKNLNWQKPISWLFTERNGDEFARIEDKSSKWSESDFNPRRTRIQILNHTVHRSQAVLDGVWKAIMDKSGRDFSIQVDVFFLTSRFFNIENFIFRSCFSSQVENFLLMSRSFISGRDFFPRQDVSIQVDVFQFKARVEIDIIKKRRLWNTWL